MDRVGPTLHLELFVPFRITRTGFMPRIKKKKTNKQKKQNKNKNTNKTKQKNKDRQTRWDIAKRHRLCHVCMRDGHHRGRCESERFCPCGSNKRHHRLLRKSPKGDTAQTNGGNQTRQGEPKPAVNQSCSPLVLKEKSSLTEPANIYLLEMAMDFMLCGF